ncbi:MAG: energy transducer TonB [Croceivirga sp.]
MKAKKNEKLQLERNSGLYFVIGLCLVLALTYATLEWKSFDEATICDVAYLDEPDPFIEDVPFIKPPELPKPKFVPVVNDLIPDDSDIEEDIPDFIESEINTPIPDTSEIPEYIEPTIEEVLDFIVVEEKPIFPGCENAMDKYGCFQKMMQNHIRKNFRYPELAIDMNQQGKVYVQFTIQKDGSINDIKLRGPHKILEKEAKRIISKLPQMSPGKQRGTPVKVPFSIPINFVLQ